MNPLTEQDLLNLLETMEPEEIRATRQLDEATLAILTRLEADIAAADEYFTQEGKKFRQDHPVAEIKFPTPHKRNGLRAILAAHSLPNWVPALAAVLVAGFLVISNLDMPGWTHTIRSGSLDMQKILPLNESLVKALVDRAGFLVDAGNRSGDKKYYREALFDLTQAHELEPENMEVLTLLVLVHEKLGNDKQADLFMQQWERLQEKEKTTD